MSNVPVREKIEAIESHITSHLSELLSVVPRTMYSPDMHLVIESAVNIKKRAEGIVEIVQLRMSGTIVG